MDVTKAFRVGNKTWRQGWRERLFSLCLLSIRLSNLAKERHGSYENKRLRVQPNFSHLKNRNHFTHMRQQKVGLIHDLLTGRVRLTEMRRIQHEL